MARRHLAGMIRPASGKTLPQEGEQVPTLKLAHSASASKGISINANTPWHDVFEMCKKGFTTKMHSMGDEILQDVRTEVTNSNSILRLELADMVEDRLKDVTGSIAQILQKVDELQMTAKENSDTDLTTVLQEMHTMDQENTKANQNITDTLGSIKDSVQEVYVRFEMEEEQLQKLVGRQDVVEEMLASISRSQEAVPLSSERLADEVAALKEQMKQECEQLGTAIRQELSQQLAENIPLSEDRAEFDVSEILKEQKRTQKGVDNNMRMVLTEIGKVQQALHIDYVNLEEQAKEDAPRKTKGENRMDRRSSIDTAGLMQTVNLKRRFREVFAQTDGAFETIESFTQTDPVRFERRNPSKKRQLQMFNHRKTEKQPGQLEEELGPTKVSKVNSTFLQDAEALKAKARAALVKPQYNLFDHYKSKGCFQAIAKSSIFDSMTLAMTLWNAVWLAVEADNSDANMWIYAELQFQVAEHVFCLYFAAELFIRFMAFAHKRSCLNDTWFIFDSALLVEMLAETYILPLIVVLAGLEVSDLASLEWLRLLRVVKILHLSRMAKILRAFPELMIIVKGIGFATRSVIVFFLLWIIIIYPFSILLKQVTAGQSVGEKYFRSVPDSMSTLFLNGIVPNQAMMIQEMGIEHPMLYILLLVFYLLASVTIMYMLVGVLVDVMGVISKTEQEGITVSYVSSQLRAEMAAIGFNADDCELRQSELQKMLVEPLIATVLGDIGVDVVGLLESLDVIYEDLRNRHGTMTFEVLIDVVLSMRGSNSATVKDVREQLRVMKAIIHDCVTANSRHLREDLAKLHADVKTLHDEVMVIHREEEHEDSDAGSDWDPHEEPVGETHHEVDPDATHHEELVGETHHEVDPDATHHEEIDRAQLVSPRSSLSVESRPSILARQKPVHFG